MKYRQTYINKWYLSSPLLIMVLLYLINYEAHQFQSTLGTIYHFYIFGWDLHPHEGTEHFQHRHLPHISSNKVTLHLWKPELLSYHHQSFFLSIPQIDVIFHENLLLWHEWIICGFEELCVIRIFRYNWVGRYIWNIADVAM